MADNKKTLLVLGCGLVLFVVAALGIKWALEHPQLIVGAIFIALVFFGLRGGSSAVQRPAPGDPEQAKRAMRRITSQSADEVIKAYEAGELTTEQRDELLAHTYRSPSGGPGGPGPGRRA